MLEAVGHCFQQSVLRNSVLVATLELLLNGTEFRQQHFSAISAEELTTVTEGLPTRLKGFRSSTMQLLKGREVMQQRKTAESFECHTFGAELLKVATVTESLCGSHESDPSELHASKQEFEVVHCHHRFLGWMDFNE